MRRVRTFIAVDIGPAIRGRLLVLQETLARATADVKWVEPENLHVTLLFLGEVGERDLLDVCRIVAEQTAKQTAFPMTVEAVGCFPNARRPRTLWVGVGQGTQDLCALHDRLENPLLDQGCYRREERKYTPHITLGRVKNNGSALELGTALARRAGWQGGQIQVREILVMGSQLTPKGPVYTVLSRAKLA